MDLMDSMRFASHRRLPIVMSAEGAECGLVCVAMIAAYHGRRADLNTLRQRFGISMAGANLRGIIRIADQLGLLCRSYRVELDSISGVELPAIIHWNMNHFVVLKSCSNGRFTIHDPALGAMSFTEKQFSDRFTGIVLELAPTATFEVKDDRKVTGLHSLGSNFRGLGQSFIQVLTLTLALQFLTFALPFQMQIVVDDALGNNDGNLLALTCFGFLFVTVLQVAITAFRDWLVAFFGNQLVFQLTANLLHHLLRLPSSYFERRHVGDILSRLSSTQAIQDVLTQGAVSGVIDGGMAIIAATVLFIYSPPLALGVMASVGLLIAATFAFYPVAEGRVRELIQAQAAEQSHLMESVRAATTVKLMGGEAEREAAWRNLRARSYNASITVGAFQISQSAVQSLIVTVQTAAIIYFGARTILMGQGFSVGMLMAFLSFRQTLTDRTLSLVTKAFQFRMLGVHLERLGDIVQERAEQEITVAPSFDLKGGMDLKAVSFRYGATDQWVLKDIDLAIAPGEYIAITGPSGGGKSTLLKLLLGLQTPELGSIQLDGRVAEASLWKALRSEIGVVTQDDKLLSGTLAENIAFFDPDMDMADVVAAANAAQIHNDIIRMPMGYMTLVGDMGSALSGGQRQRILLARALYIKPKMLFLDEGTANLDLATEAAIGEVISALSITRVVVAHRPALIERADRILVLEGGRLTLQGRKPSVAAPVKEVTFG